MSDNTPGSLVFCHSTGIIGHAIRLGERLRFRSGDFFNHVAIIDTDGTIIQAEAHGVTAGASLESIAPGGSYEVVKVPDAIAANIITFARSQVGKKYGYLSIVGLAIRILTPKWLPLPSIRANRTWICSALGGESTRFGGWFYDWDDIYSVVPSELYAAIKGIGVRDAYLESLRESVSNYDRTRTQTTHDCGCKADGKCRGCKD